MRALLTCAVALWLSGCAADPSWERRFVSIEGTLARAEEAGAMRCAPRELALGRAHLGFATFERERGQRARAEEHLAIAEPNAGAALYLSPAARCSGHPPLEEEPASSESQAPIDTAPLTDAAPGGDDPGDHDVTPPRDPSETPDSTSTPDPSGDVLLTAAPAPSKPLGPCGDRPSRRPRAGGR